jgi:hypothetical protein
MLLQCRYWQRHKLNYKGTIALGRKTVLPGEIEARLFNYCIDIDATYFGSSTADVRRLAYQLAIRTGLPHPFSHNKSAAGNKWLKGFFKLHPRLSMRTPQGLSATKSYSNRKSRSQQVLPSSSGSEFEDPIAINTDDDNDDDYAQ